MKFINFGMEAIAFQSPEFADAMISLFEKILQERSGKTADSSDAAKKLTKLVRDATGMKVDIIFDTEYPPCTLPYHINPDTILGHSTLKDFYVEESKATLDRLKKIKQSSSIDLKNGKVTGIFSEINVPIWMSYMQLKQMRLNARECAAITAHEIGHCFVAYELAFRTSKTNQILSAIAKAHASGDKGEYKYVLKTTEDVFDLKTGVLDEALEAKNAETAMIVTLGRINKKDREASIMGNSTYDITTFEALADNYATRLGLGKDLLIGLEKIYKAYGSTEYSGTARVLATVMDIISTTAIIGAALGAIGGSPISAAFLGFYLFLQWVQLDGRDHNNVYDKLSIRYKRVKEQIIAYIKDKNLPAKEARKALESIAHIEKMIQEVSEYKGFIVPILNMIDPASRAVISAREIQQNLETVAANDLYVKATQIRTLD